MSEIVTIRCQQRFHDGDMSKKPFKWASVPMDEQGNVEAGVYEVSCASTGSKKALLFNNVELPSEVSEIASIEETRVLSLVRAALLQEAKDEGSATLRERYESPEQKKRREAKEAATIREYLGEKMQGWTDANPNTMPPVETFQAWQKEAAEAAKGK